MDELQSTITSNNSISQSLNNNIRSITDIFKNISTVIFHALALSQDTSSCLSTIYKEYIGYIYRKLSM